MLIDAENSEYPDAPVNPYRKLLGMKPLQPLCLKLTYRLFFTNFVFFCNMGARPEDQS